jgi:hypothetical protein
MVDYICNPIASYSGTLGDTYLSACSRAQPEPAPDKTERTTTPNDAGS